MNKESYLKKHKKKLVSNVLTRHFCLYVMHIKPAFDNIKRKMDKRLVQAWINKLMENPHPDILNAIRRNTFIARLLINMYDGKLETPFTEMPTNKSLDTLNELLFGEDRDNKQDEEDNLIYEVSNKELPLDELNHISSDERMFIAIRSLADGHTLFGYVAVTIGQEGAEPLWVNCRGETVEIPTPKLEDLLVISSASREIEFCLSDQAKCGLDDLVHEVWNILSRRQTQDIGERAIEFYRMLYNAVEQEMVAEENGGHSYSCRDPYVDKLIEFMMDDLTAKDVRDSKAFCRLRLLSNLKMRIKAVTDHILNRQEVFKQVKELKTIPAMQIIAYPSNTYLINVSAAKLQESFDEILNKKFFYMINYNKQYSSHVMNLFKKVLNNEKDRIIHSIKTRSDILVREMYSSLEETVNQGLCKYQAARKEWFRAWHVIREHEETSKCLTKQGVAKYNDNTSEKFLNVIKNEIGIALKQLKSAKLIADNLRKKNDSLITRIHNLNEEYELEKMYGDDEKRILKDGIEKEKLTGQQKINTIKHLQFMINYMLNENC